MGAGGASTAPASGDEAGFAAAAVELAGDAGARAALGAAARAQALRHDWAGIVRRFEAVLVQAIERDAHLGAAMGPLHPALH